MSSILTLLKGERNNILDDVSPLVDTKIQEADDSISSLITTDYNIYNNGIETGMTNGNTDGLPYVAIPSVSDSIKTTYFNHRLFLSDGARINDLYNARISFGSYIENDTYKSSSFRFRNTWNTGFNHDGSTIYQVQAISNAGNYYTSVFRITSSGSVFTNNSKVHSSDDRIKTNEQYITDATETLLKLKPQIYNKYMDTDCSGYNRVESGLIAQEMYYDAPELRHLVSVPDALQDASGNPMVADHIETSADPSVDPDYSSWDTGDKTQIASVNYEGLIAYVIASLKERELRLRKLETYLNI